MKNVIVYRCGKVVADGVLLRDVRDVSPPFNDGEGPVFGSVTFDITGELAYSPLTREKACQTPPKDLRGWGAQPAPVVTRQAIDDMYQNGKINYGPYRELCTVMGCPAPPPPPPPPPPEPEHPDTARVRKVRQYIEALHVEGAFTSSVHCKLLSALA